MSGIPPDIYDRVLELAAAIANAINADDEALGEALFQTLRTYYDEQTSLGRSHPFLTEALADFTEDTSEAVRLYDLSLRQARAFPGEPTHTKLISLGEQLMELGRMEQAEACLRDGQAEALRCGDTFWIEEADQLQKKLKA